MSRADSPPASHMHFVEGLSAAFDLLLLPVYLTLMDPTIETYALFRSVSFFTLCSSFGCALGLAFASLSRKSKGEEIDPIVVFLLAATLLLWAVCANPSMLVVVKMALGVCSGHLRHSSALHETEPAKHVATGLGALFALMVIRVCNKPSTTASVLACTCLLVAALHYSYSIVRGAAKYALTVPPTHQIPRKEQSAPASLELGEGRPSQAPARYVRGCGGDAEARWELTLRWRADNGIDTLLQEEQPRFALLKECYPQYFHGRSKQGCPVLFEQLGLIDVRRLKANGVDKAALLRHYLFIMEYLWTQIEPDEELGRVVTVLDIRGVSVYDLMGDALEFLKLTSKTIQLHYVERCSHMYIVNAPMFFNLVWKVVAPLLHENTRRKIRILSGDTSELLQCIDASQLPVEYGGTDKTPLGSSVDELRLREFVRAIKPGGSGSAKTLRRADVQDVSEFVLSSVTDVAPWLRQQPDADESDDEGDAEESEWTRLSAWVRGVSRSVLGVRDRPDSRPVSRVSSRTNLQAHMGAENAYVYDRASKSWTLDQTSASADLLDDSERDIVRAIEAAHERRYRGAADSPMKKCDVGFARLSALYFLWRAQVSACLFALPVSLHLPFLRGGFGMSIRSIALLFIAAVVLTLLTLASSLVFKALSFIDNPKRCSMLLMRMLHQLLGAALSAIAMVVMLYRDVVDRPFEVAECVFPLLALSTFVLLCSSTACSMGLASLYSASSVPAQYCSFFLVAADSIGGCVCMCVMSFVFGDVGVSKYNSYIALPFVAGAAMHTGLGYLAWKCNHPIHTAVNFLIPPE